MVNFMTYELYLNRKSNIRFLNLGRRVMKTFARVTAIKKDKQ